jgi:hypothetical protein
MATRLALIDHGHSKGSTAAAMADSAPSPSNPPSRLQALLRFGFRALRVTCSTVAMVALLQEQWVAGGCFGVAWLLLLAAPRLFPQIQTLQESKP